MKLTKKFTFKTDVPTGRYRAFDHDIHNIKLNKAKCGLIDDSIPHKIRLQVMKNDINEDGNPNCEWKWITLEKESKTLQEAKDWLNLNFEKMNACFKIYREDR